VFLPHVGFCSGDTEIAEPEKQNAGPKGPAF
jgi:hypothetical protein